MSFSAAEGKHSWSNGYQHGTVEIKDNGMHKSVKLSSISGELSLQSFFLNGFGSMDFEGAIIVPVLRLQHLKLKTIWKNNRDYDKISFNCNL